MMSHNVSGVLLKLFCPVSETIVSDCAVDLDLSIAPPSWVSMRQAVCGLFRFAFLVRKAMIDD